jgi:inhibitor of KinA sporulation pathway (predicted exonuclease)
MGAKLTKPKQEKIIKEAKDMADAWFSGFSENIKRYNDQLKFWLSMRDQWSSDERALLTQYNKIPLTCPKIYGIARRILGEQRQSTPDLQVFGITDKATPESIKLRDDFVRTTCFHSDAHVAYQTAYRSVLFGGFGAFKVYSKYENEKSFNQCLIIEKILDPTTCFWDIGAREFSKEDGMGCGEYIVMGRKKFEARYPGIEVTNDEILPTSAKTYVSKDEVAIVIFQRKEYFNKTIIQLTSGEVVDLKQYEERVQEYVEMKKMELQEAGMPIETIIEIPEELKVVKKRSCRDYRIRKYKIAGEHVLEHSTWPSKYLGYIFVDGDSSYLSGKQVTKPFFEDAQDLQRFGNYTFTQINHLTKSMRNEQWLASPANVAGFEDIWNTPELTQSALLANPDDLRGGAMPINIQAGMISPTLIQQYDSLMQNINTTLGIYDAYEGNQGREISGKAIDNRVKQGNIATFIVNSNLNRAIGQCGRVVLDVFPRIYDTERQMRLKSRDGDARTVTLNKSYDGKIENDTSGEDYYIEIDAGSSFEGQRQEALDSMRELLQINPSISQLTADLFAENLPLQNSQVIVKRLRAAMVPKEVVAAGNGEELPPPPQPEPPPEVEYMKADLALREQKLQMDAAAKGEEQRLKEQKLQLDKDKDEFQAYVAQEKLNLERAKLGVY